MFRSAARKITLLIIMVLALSVQGVFAADGNKSASSFTAAVPVVTVSSYKDVNRIKWKKIPGASSYRVYRASEESRDYKLLGKTKSASLKDKTADSGAVYYYKVRAFNDKGQRSKYSPPVRFQTIYRVFIACGHGTNLKGVWDSGCTYKGMQEAKLMLPITQDFVSYMRKSGVYVYTDADDGNNINMIKCIRKANKKRISAYISIHCDWKHAPSGTLPLYKSKEDKKLAKALNKGVHKSVKIKDRGLTKRTALRELRKTKAPASCIFETGSISKDYKVFKKKHKAYGRGLAKGLCKYLGVEFAG